MNRLLLAVAFAAALILPKDQSKDLEHRSAVRPSQRIEIKGLSGAEIEFKTWEKNEVYLKLNLHISSSDEDYENEYIRSFEVQERSSESLLQLEFKEPSRSVSSGFWSIFKGGSYMRKEIRGEIYVPASNALTTDLSYGAITMNGIKGEVNILGKNNNIAVSACGNLHHVTNDYGTTEIADAGGDLDLEGTSSRVTVAKFKGSAAIDANYSNITLTDVTRSVTVRSQSGTVSAEDIGGDLKIQSDYSKITVSRVKGFLDVSTTSGSLKVDNVQGLLVNAPYTSVDARDVSGTEGKDLIVNNQSAPISLDNIKSNVRINGPYSNVELKDITGSVDVQSTSSNIAADGISGNWTSNTSYSTLRLRGLQSKTVSIRNKGASVETSHQVVPAELEIRNEYGNVVVDIPKGFSGDVSLDAEYGRVSTDLPVQTRNRASSGYAVGKVGSGSGKITIETRSGNVELNER